MEIKARGGKVISIVTEGDKEIKKISDDFIEIPECHELISPILANIPLQLLSYYIADFKGCSIDQPRNLGKVCYGGVIYLEDIFGQICQCGI